MARIQTIALGSSLALALVFLAGAPAAAGEGDCITANIDLPIRFPDGSVEAPGQLTLCDWRTFSPVVNIHRSYVNGRPVNMLLGRRRASEGGGRVPSEMFFTRAGDELELYVRGSTLRSYHNSTLINSTTDATYAGGRIGFAVTTAPIDFTQWTVTDRPA